MDHRTMMPSVLKRTRSTRSTRTGEGQRIARVCKIGVESAQERARPSCESLVSCGPQLRGMCSPMRDCMRAMGSELEFWNMVQATAGWRRSGGSANVLGGRPPSSSERYVLRSSNGIPTIV